MDKWHQLSLRRELLFTLQTFICGPKQTLFTMLLEFLTLMIRDEISTKIQVETYFNHSRKKIQFAYHSVH